ncbi:class IV lanthionine synthetase LanL [Kitasatospora azatica]|uniref:class IV lanthionine synthetase LanL n=1 Tax=Kitasatospora azatica TaxID=58347 RepID=UPI0012FC17FE|nr:class IV lanthionine synthetase LanL [Kitasatospora azatica]
MHDFRLQSVVEAVLAERGLEGWTFNEDKVWCRVTPAGDGGTDRIQGWKLHVSATRLSAPEVLYRVAHVLVPRGVAFKFSRSIRMVEEMTGERYDRAQCGKIIAIYPSDEDQFRELATALDKATAGLPGPAVLNDRPVRPGSLVHYRFGAFRGVPVLTDDGVFEIRVADPDGTPVEDVRKPWFCPPSWAELPYPAPPKTTKPGALLADRFEVRQAIRHSARGGVYKALDHRTGAEVIVKQARAYVGGRLNGDDCRAGLRNEWDALTALAGIAAEPVDIFDLNGHTFLVESLVPGTTLAQWVDEQLAGNDGQAGLAPAQLLDMARKLTELMAEVHARGLVFQDFTPLNIMVTPDGGLKLIDPEMARVPGEWGVRGHTIGFAALEVVGHPGEGWVPQQTADLYSLGAVLQFLAVGTAPMFGTDAPKPLSVHDRLADVLRVVGLRNAAARMVAPAVSGLTADDPEQRWSLDRLREFLATCTVPAAAAVSEEDIAAADRLSDADRQRFTDDGLAHLLAAMAAPGDDAGRLWPSTDFGNGTDPCNVQHGSAGVLGLLTLADRHLQRDDLRAAVTRTAAWTAQRRDAIPRLLPGLYFGRSGTAWALFDAARHLGDEELEQQAVDLALAVPVEWPNPDVCHGVAGSVLTQLHLWRHTGRGEFLERATKGGEALLAAAEHTDGQVYWPIPDGLDSLLSGISHLGFAHGVAGVGYALLAIAQATGDERYLTAAVAAGNTLVAEAERGPSGAHWRNDRSDEPGTGMRTHWCSGSSGVGTFLLRLWQTTGDAEYLHLTEQAAQAVRHARWYSGTAACHGLAGNGEFLLDLADAVGGPYRGWAEELASSMVLRHGVRGGLLVIPDESSQGAAVDYNVGLSGTVGFLLRLAHGGGRPWMADGAAEQAVDGVHRSLQLVTR